MNRTSIEWVKNPDGTQGYTWNPITGCLNGCEYCYARKLANTRLKERYLANDNVAEPDERIDFDMGANGIFTNPFYPRFWEDKIGEPLRGNRLGKGIFTCNMSDLFGIGIPEEWTNKVLNIASLTPENRFYLLTKQPQNLTKFSPFPDNCWVGVTTTGEQQMWNKAMFGLGQIQAKVKFLSLEPLLEHQAIYPSWLTLLGRPLIQWVIIGQKTPIVAYEKPYWPKIEWVKEIVEACDKAGIPVFLKQNLWDCLYTYAWDDDIFWATDKAKLRQELPNRC
ncbi:hypothetical protein LCGC14_0488510 [marine sediment metagenome]|uniref:DUF5131 family protein n=1 Tax=marine sediment metagenome TaxID=412755 RepID=A0A0F9SCG6_9ZZZZ